MDTTLSVKDIENMIVRYRVTLRSEIVIPNLWWGLLPYEADLVVIDKNGYMREYEIRRSYKELKSDFKFKKDRFHVAEQVTQFFYVLPYSIKEKAIALFRLRNKTDAYVKAFGESTERTEAFPAIIFYNDNGEIVEQTSTNGYICGNHRKLSLEERLTITRLLSIRLWNLSLSKKKPYIAPDTQVVETSAPENLMCVSSDNNYNGKPGNGWGDKNHDHFGSPGQNKKHEFENI